MKILILFLVYGATVYASAQQQEILFKQEIKPGKQYTWTTMSVVNSTIDVSGSDEAMQKVKINRHDYPTIQESSSESVRELKTGSLKADNSFPATSTNNYSTEIIVENGKRTVSAKKDPVISYSGFYNSKNKFEVVSATDSAGKNLSKKQLYAFKTNYKRLQENLGISPNKLLKIGEGYDHKGKAIVRVPGCSNTVIMNLNSKYILKKIENNIATFDIIITVGMDASSRKGNFKVSGTGRGTAEFDTNLNYIVKSETTEETVTKLIMNDVQMTGVFKTKTIQDTKIK